MNKLTLIVSLFFVFSFSVASAKEYPKLYGEWKGVKMFQDENSYDGRTFFLPNEGEMILSQSSVKLYYYPYFKSAEFNVVYSDESIIYHINDKEIRCDYSFRGDTLEFQMHYINKVFVKLFVPTKMNAVIVKDLDRFGFRTEKLVHEFELDTLHPDQRKGFTSYDSIGFAPFKYIKFTGENTLIINRKDNVTYKRDFKKISFSYNGVINEMEVFHIGGTQDIFLKPITQCECDSIIVPYMTVRWADRIRQAIIDEENF